jgi:hypothetical protein
MVSNSTITTTERGESIEAWVKQDVSILRVYILYRTNEALSIIGIVEEYFSKRGIQATLWLELRGGLRGVSLGALPRPRR